MWPFKSKPVKQFAEFAAEQEHAPCGEQETHYYWTLVEGWSCPVCAAIEQKKEKELEQDRLAEKIAEAIVKKIEI